MWNYCPQCSHRLESGWKFCAGCGMQVNAVPAALPPVQTWPYIWPTIYPAGYPGSTASRPLPAPPIITCGYTNPGAMAGGQIQ